MSTDEQDLTFGRLTREAKECRQRVGAIEAKLSAFSEALSTAALTLNGTWNPKPRPVTPVEDALAALATIPEQQAIAEALHDLRAERDRLAETERQLRAME